MRPLPARYLAPLIWLITPTAIMLADWLARRRLERH